MFFIFWACNFGKKCDFFYKNCIVENNEGPKNSQHPPISRRLPLFDVQIFTLPHRACLRGSRRCVGVLFASCSLCVSFRKFKIAVSILCSIYIKRSFLQKNKNLSESHLVYPLKRLGYLFAYQASNLLRIFLQPSHKENFLNISDRWINFTDSYQQMRGKYACLNSKVDCSVFFLLRKREREREREKERERRMMFFSILYKKCYSTNEKNII